MRLAATGDKLYKEQGSGREIVPVDQKGFSLRQMELLSVSCGRG